MTRLRLLCASSVCRPHFSSSFFPDILHIHARVLCVDPSVCLSVHPSVSPSVPQHGAVVCASEPVLCPSYARGRASSSSSSSSSSSLSFASPPSLLLPLLLVTASSGPGVCVFLEDTRAHASRWCTPAHLPRLCAVFSSVVGEKQPIEGRVCRLE